MPDLAIFRQYGKITTISENSYCLISEYSYNIGKFLQYRKIPTAWYRNIPTISENSYNIGKFLLRDIGLFRQCRKIPMYIFEKSHTCKTRTYDLQITKLRSIHCAISSLLNEQKVKVSNKQLNTYSEGDGSRPVLASFFTQKKKYRRTLWTHCLLANYSIKIRKFLLLILMNRKWIRQDSDSHLLSSKA